MARPFVFGVAVLTFILALIFVVFGLDLFEDDESPADAAATSTPTPEDATDATPTHTFPSRVYELYGEVVSSNGVPMPKADSMSDVTVLVGRKGIQVELHLDIEQLVDLDDLGGDSEASDVVCATIDLRPSLWLKAVDGPNDDLHAKAPVDVQIGYSEDECPGQSGNVESRPGTVDVTIGGEDGNARGTLRIGTSTLEFAAEPLEER